MTYGKILFMGTPAFALPALQALYDVFPSQLNAVFTQPDRARGRGKKVQPTPIKEWAASKEITVYTPENKNDLVEQVTALNPDLIIVIAYGMIFPKQLTDTYFCVNVHASLLPKYRGASPIHAALLNLDEQTGLTVMKMNEKMDAGLILAKETISIHSDDCFETLHDRLSNLAAEILIHFIKEAFIKDQIDYQEQASSLVSYCHKIQKQDLQLDLTEDPKLLLGKIKAFSPKPGAYIIKQDKRVKILDANIEAGQLIIMVVQPEGKRPMPYSDYLLSHPPL